MNRYMLFAGNKYYPSGGMQDYVASDNDSHKLMRIGEGYNWAHILDTDGMMVVAYQENFYSQADIDWVVVPESLDDFRAKPATGAAAMTTCETHANE